MQYNNFLEKYAAYEDKYMEKRSFVESLLPTLAEHMPALANHIPPEGAVGLGATAAKYLAIKGIGNAAGALIDARKLSRRFGSSLYDGIKMRGTPQANLVLGKAVPTAQSKTHKVLSTVDKASDVASVGYNAAILTKNLL